MCNLRVGQSILPVLTVQVIETLQTEMSGSSLETEMPGSRLEADFRVQ